MWLADGGTLVLAGTLVALTSPGAFGLAVLWQAAFAALVLSLLTTRGLYRPRLDPRILDTTRSVVTATALATAIVISLRVFFADSSSLASEGARMWAVATLLLVTARFVITLTQRQARLTPSGGQPTLIVGAGNVGHLVAARLSAHPELGLRPVGFLDKEPLSSDEARSNSPDLPVLGASWDLDRVVAEQGIRQVVVTFSTAPAEVLVRLLERCERLGVRTAFVPRLFEKTTEQFTVDHLGGVPLISTHAANPRGLQFGLKYGLDRVAAAIAIIVLSPLLAALALAVLISLGRPILYRQERVGRDGRYFDMLKFRSMRPATGDEAPVFDLASGTAPGGVEGADRRTRVGTFLRRTSLDELPQLLNVLKGEMSFVGPRPERPEFVEMFEQTVHRYGDRHRVKSGITGWAQVNGLRGKTSVADRAEWDNYYIENWSPWLDLKILLATVIAVARPGAVE